MIYWNDKNTVDTLKNVLDQDQIILASGDTVLGLWGNITQSAFVSLNTIKQRQKKPYLLVIGSIDKLNFFIDQTLNESLSNLVKTCWPGPVTLIFKAKKDLPNWLVSLDGTIALRIPDHQGLLKLLQHYDGLFSTSANINGGIVPDSIKNVDQIILQQVGTICLDEGQLIYPQLSSTILNCSTGTIEVVRSGSFSIDILQNLCS